VDPPVEVLELLEEAEDALALVVRDPAATVAHAHLDPAEAERDLDLDRRAVDSAPATTSGRRSPAPVRSSRKSPSTASGLSFDFTAAASASR